MMVALVVLVEIETFGVFVFAICHVHIVGPAEALYPFIALELYRKSHAPYF